MDGFVHGISTTAVPSAGSTIEVCLPFRPDNASPILYQYEAGPLSSWVARTTSIDPVRHVVCGDVTTLSPVAVPEPLAPWAPVVAWAAALVAHRRAARNRRPSEVSH